MSTTRTLWPYAAPTVAEVKAAPYLNPAKAKPEPGQYIAAIGKYIGEHPRVWKVISYVETGARTGVIVTKIAWDIDPEKIGKDTPLQTSTVSAYGMRVYTPRPVEPPVTAAVIKSSDPIPALTAPGVMAGLSTIHGAITDGFKQNFANQSELADLLTETNQILREILACMQLAWGEEGQK